MKTRGRCAGRYALATVTNIAVFSAPPPRPCTKRPATSWTIVSEVPATTRPTVKTPRPTSSGRDGPIRSQTRPDSTVASSIPMTKSENAQA